MVSGGVEDVTDSHDSASTGGTTGAAGSSPHAAGAGVGKESVQDSGGSADTQSQKVPVFIAPTPSTDKHNLSAWGGKRPVLEVALHR